MSLSIVLLYLGHRMKNANFKIINIEKFYAFVKSIFLTIISLKMATLPSLFFISITFPAFSQSDEFSELMNYEFNEFKREIHETTKQFLRSPVFAKKVQWFKETKAILDDPSKNLSAKKNALMVLRDKINNDQRSTTAIKNHFWNNKDDFFKLGIVLSVLMSWKKNLEIFEINKNAFKPFLKAIKQIVHQEYWQAIDQKSYPKKKDLPYSSRYILEPNHQLFLLISDLLYFSEKDYIPQLRKFLFGEDFYKGLYDNNPQIRKNEKKVSVYKEKTDEMDQIITQIDYSVNMWVSLLLIEFTYLPQIKQFMDLCDLHECEYDAIDAPLIKQVFFDGHENQSFPDKSQSSVLQIFFSRHLYELFYELDFPWSVRIDL